MSLPIKKAVDVVAKTVIPAASRAVTAKEAASIVPSAVSSTETSMAWKGWFSSFLEKSLGSKKYELLRSYIVFMPSDQHNLEQQPFPETKIPITEDGKLTAKFRYPSPGSQIKVRIPEEDVGTTHEDPYFGSYYARDTRRRDNDPAFPNPELEEMKLALLPSNDPLVKEAKERFEEGPLSSPGNKGTFATGFSDYDPEGLRASMSANHEALNKSLDANMPDHLPAPKWWDDQDEVADWHTERGLPVPIGKTEFGTIPREGRLAKW